MEAERIIRFLYELKISYRENEFIYTQGSCFRLFKILSAIYPEAKPYYSHVDGHWITEIQNSFYDINGEINPSYVESNKYEEVTDKIMLASAYIPTYKGQTTPYSKYCQILNLKH